MGEFIKNEDNTGAIRRDDIAAVMFNPHYETQSRVLKPALIVILNCGQKATLVFENSAAALSVLRDL